MSHYQQTDRRALYAVLDQALVAHLSIVRHGCPMALPVGFARDGDSILIHGSTGSAFFRDVAEGQEFCVNVTHLDGIMYARSLFDSSMRYRAAVIYGRASVVSAQKKEAALLKLAEHLMPQRQREIRPMTQKELAATMVLRIPLETASVKDNRASSPDEPNDDHSVWAGTLPLHVVAGEPETSSATQSGVAPPESVLTMKARFTTQ
ncbi:pyridoxamine 5'-phosphate oxidase family protein [Nesterenkonia populi]|uniref:pyridoxamine 5'-phosphate oxidase family protein n=1 Tax=Nesterenkonia populi TaxID=1591087 RepID=UPI001478A896|nr:pyridoxamine 5'-phosphate oxidase family protein [Nesterenkonia populi]